MEEIQNLFQGFGVALTLPNLGFMLIGITLGVLIGVLPGLGGANGVAILLPLTFSMNPTSAIIMLSCIYWGALFGGAITSILFNIPGEPWSVATTFDGYPMAQQGRAAQALTAAFTSSLSSARIFAVLLITFSAPLLARFALKFGPAEFFAVQLLTFCSFVGMSKEPPAKTMAAMMLGFALAAVGMDTVTGHAAHDLRRARAAEGLRLPDRGDRPVRHRRNPADDGRGPGLQGQERRISFRVVWQTWGELLRYWKLSCARCSWLLDGHHPRRRNAGLVHELRHGPPHVEDPQRFGKGKIEGVVAPETAAHAAGTSALLPMLDPAFYQLVDELTGDLLVPEQVQYTAATNQAVLDFADDLSDSTYRLQIGVSDEPNNSGGTAINIGTLVSALSTRSMTVRSLWMRTATPF